MRITVVFFFFTENTTREKNKIKKGRWQVVKFEKKIDMRLLNISSRAHSCRSDSHHCKGMGGIEIINADSMCLFALLIYIRGGCQLRTFYSISAPTDRRNDVIRGRINNDNNNIKLLSTGNYCVHTFVSRAAALMDGLTWSKVNKVVSIDNTLGRGIFNEGYIKQWRNRLFVVDFGLKLFGLLTGTSSRSRSSSRRIWICGNRRIGMVVGDGFSRRLIDGSTCRRCPVVDCDLNRIVPLSIALFVTRNNWN